MPQVEALESGWEQVSSSQEKPLQEENWTYWGAVSSYLWTTPSATAESSLGSKTVTPVSWMESYFNEHKEALQEELKAFFEEDLSLGDLLEFIKALNTVYPKYRVIPKDNLLEQIRERKAQMLAEGERIILSTPVGYYALVFTKDSTSVREVLQKTFNHIGETQKYSDSITYEQTILGFFANKHLGG